MVQYSATHGPTPGCEPARESKTSAENEKMEQSTVKLHCFILVSFRRPPPCPCKHTNTDYRHRNSSPGKTTNHLTSTVSAGPIQMLTTPHPKRDPTPSPHNCWLGGCPPGATCGHASRVGTCCVWVPSPWSWGSEPQEEAAEEGHHICQEQGTGNHRCPSMPAVNTPFAWALAQGVKPAPSGTTQKQQAHMLMAHNTDSWVSSVAV
ncbi:hypothetical protein CRENBAI_000303 [Crenichthys baileyi]|uniref:Uncharacterized protein n=1 Tax=Crenichthys baileyi TaxID=28760 RepID=A0AAV9R8F3_9TELE